MINYKKLSKKISLAITLILLLSICGLILVIFFYVYQPITATAQLNAPNGVQTDSLSQKIDKIKNEIDQKKSTRKMFYKVEIKDSLFKSMN